MQSQKNIQSDEPFGFAQQAKIGTSVHAIETKTMIKWAQGRPGSFTQDPNLLTAVQKLRAEPLASRRRRRSTAMMLAGCRPQRCWLLALLWCNWCRWGWWYSYLYLPAQVKAKDLRGAVLELRRMSLMPSRTHHCKWRKWLRHWWCSLNR